LDQPLDYDDVDIDSFLLYWVFDRWSGIFPDAMMIQDVAFYPR
jgi:hypothetical protein